MNNKSCRLCYAELLISFFHKDKSKDDGHVSACKECVGILSKKYYSRNKCKQVEQMKKWVQNNKQKVNSYKKKYRKNHPGFSHERLIRATPAWVNKKEIIEIYKIRDKLTAETGILHHVDHIVPLCGKNVCGLHVPWNLQILPAVDNLRNGNKYE